MPRPKKCRRICGLPRHERFGPLEAGKECSVVEMTVDEFEVIRLMDQLDYTQEECAGQLEVARTTVQLIYDTARKKLADALVNGKQLLIQGGEYRLCTHAGHCHGKNCKMRGCAKAYLQDTVREKQTNN